MQHDMSSVSIHAYTCTHTAHVASHMPSLVTSTYAISINTVAFDAPLYPINCTAVTSDSDCITKSGVLWYVSDAGARAHV